ncbi:amidohydrolase family protein [Roseobacter sp. S98]|uniref:amidohydrolase family protein n=1 Tax=Roseobacter algicola (ex Choi et al. 2025) (nom. illeg.) TaxID=3092138 RepID=UPI003F51A57C
MTQPKETARTVAYQTNPGTGPRAVLPGVSVPVSQLADPDRFGGTATGDLRCGTLCLAPDGTAHLEPSGSDSTNRYIVLPRLTEAHVHLDKCHSIGRLGDVGGDLAAALAAQRRDKRNWTADDLRTRMQRGLTELRQAGCGALRTHIDWATGTDHPDTPLAWDIMADLSAAARDAGITVQAAALTGIDEMATPGAAQAVARRVARDGGALGSFLLSHANMRAGLRALFDAATHFGLPLDFHVDEGLDPTLDGLGLIADIALETGFEGPILCGHACSLAVRDTDDLQRTADKLAHAGIAVAALPSTNLYLQGRRGGTPTARGITMLHELDQAGVQTIIGTDNVRDAFCPIGRHDPIWSLGLAVLTGHLDPPFGAHLKTITTHPRSAMGLTPLSVDTAAPSELIAFPAADLSELLTGAAQPVPLTDLLTETRHD